ncbi:hypothetical protein VTJ83DRAFT_6213 [Remersonia thermophila]|uniref:Chitin-binding type-4 domain-containing protein n=1 Tax=Remersonia thermophila TaxID=72144 RepID=A0ABR4D449_9PEZI
MRVNLVLLSGLASLASLASGHGRVTAPATRSPGDATAAVCGQTLVDFYQKDPTSYPEALLRSNPGGLKAPYDPEKCNLWLCKGYQFEESANNVQTYTPGQVVNFEVSIRIAHRGYANVSVVDTRTNTIIAGPLISWPSDYAASLPPPADQTNFSVAIPELGNQCIQAGDCVSALLDDNDLKPLFVLYSPPSKESHLFPFLCLALSFNNTHPRHFSKRANGLEKNRSSSGIGSVADRPTSRVSISLLLPRVLLAVTAITVRHTTPCLEGWPKCWGVQSDQSPFRL